MNARGNYAVDCTCGFNLNLENCKNIEYIGDYSFSGECEVTGKFPFRGLYKGDVKPYFFAGKNNPELINKTLLF